MDNMGQPGDRQQADIDQRSSWFGGLIRAACPGVERINHVTDANAQQHGIDLQLFMRNGFVDTWDCKFREGVYDDVCLEYQHVHSDGKIVLGWVNKHLWCRHVAYCFKPVRQLLLIPWAELQL